MFARLLTTAAVLFVTPTISFADDLYGATSGWSGAVDGSLAISERTDTDGSHSLEGSPFFGFSVGGYVTTQIPSGHTLTFDGRFTEYGFGSYDYLIPKGSGALGVHLGTHVMRDTFVGGFAAVGVFDGHDHDYMPGYIVGVEGTAPIGTATGFGQLGYGHLIGEPGGNEFKGPIGRIGAGFDLSNSMSLVVDAEGGYSFDCFVDCGNEPGYYGSIGADLERQFADGFAAFVGVEFLAIHDEDDHDTGTEINAHIGISKSFGGARGQNLLATPMGAFKAAGWMHPLD